MSKTYPLALRERVVSYVDEGHSHRSAAAHFRVSPRFVNDMIKLRKQTGGLIAKPRGRGFGKGKLSGHEDWVRDKIAAHGDITLMELSAQLEAERGVSVHFASVWHLLKRLKLSYKKNAASQRTKT